MGVIRDAANSAYPDGPASQPAQPQKSAIRSLFATVEDAITAAGEGIQAASTWTALAAITSVDVGRLGRVTGPDAGTHTDPVVGGTVANTGEYIRASTGWQRTGDLVNATVVQSNADAVNKLSMLANPGAPIIEDISGVIAGTAAVFVPRSLYAKEVGGAGSAISIGTESTELAGYAKITVNSGNLTRITANLDTTAIFAVEYSGSLPVITGRTRHIIDVQGFTYKSDFQVVSTRGYSRSRILLNGPLVYDDGNLLVPALAYQDEISSALTYGPASGNMFTEFAMDQASAEMVYFDRYASLRGETPLKKAAFNAATRFGGYRIAPIASVYGGKLSCINQTLARIVATEFGHGKGDNDTAPVVYQSTTAVAVTDATLLGLGFTRGWSGNNGVPYYGGRFLKKRSGWLAVRFYIGSDTDNDWGDPRLYLQTTSLNVQVASANRFVEKTYSARVRSYLFWVKVAPSDGYISLIVGTHSAAGRNMVVCGLQFAFATERNIWIGRSDYPSAIEVEGQSDNGIPDAAPDMLMPSDIYLIEGRRQMLYARNAMEVRTNIAPWSYTFDIGPTTDGLKSPLAIESGGTIILDPSYMSGPAKIVARQFSQSPLSRTISAGLTIHSTPVSGLVGKSPTIAIIGDSISAWTGTSPALKAILTALGMTPTFVGTMGNLNDTHNVWSGNVNGEARGGREFADYIGMHVDDMVPVTDSAAYLALSDADKVAQNPFLRTATGSDDPANVFNGRVFDYGNYRATYSVAAPSHAVLNLGTNDGLQQTAANMIDQINKGLNAMVPSMRADLSTLQIGLAIQQSAAGDDDFWNEKRSQLIRTILGYVRDLGDSRVRVIPVYLHQSTETGWYFDLGDADPETGRLPATVDDTVHLAGTGVAQYAEAVAAWIASTV